MRSFEPPGTQRVCQKGKRNASEVDDPHARHFELTARTEGGRLTDDRGISKGVWPRPGVSIRRHDARARHFPQTIRYMYCHLLCLLPLYTRTRDPAPPVSPAPSLATPSPVCHTAHSRSNHSHTRRASSGSFASARGSPIRAQGMP